MKNSIVRAVAILTLIGCAAASAGPRTPVVKPEVENSATTTEALPVHTVEAVMEIETVFIETVKLSPRKKCSGVGTRIRRNCTGSKRYDSKHDFLNSVVVH